MKKRLLIAILVFGLAAGAASANVLTIRMNYFVPRLTTGNFWDIEFENMQFKKTTFQDVSLGIQYEAFVSRDFSLVIGLDIFKKSKGAYYKDWVGYELEDGDYAFPADEFRGDFVPSHSLTYSVAPLQASIKWTPFGRRGNVIPYIGGGVNATFWNVRIQGDQIFFKDEYIYEDQFGQVLVYPIYKVDARESDGLGRVSFGWQAFGGLMIPVGRRMTIDVGGQYFSCPAEFTNAFEGFQPIDVGGYQFSLGVNYWF
ncbi:MAG: hypothetical protein NTW38_12930 [Candidatus Aminicenantes bacterium]|nr:hypothetical protein [Candidatus Aminicenantes bacterium]